MIIARDFSVSDSLITAGIHVTDVATIDLSGASVHVSAHPFRSDDALHALHLVVKGLRRSGWLMLREKTSTIARLHRRGQASTPFSGDAQVCARRNHGQVRRHHATFTPLALVDAKLAVAEITPAKVSAGDGSDGAANARVGPYQTGIGKEGLASANGQRSNKAATVYIHHIDVGYIDYVDAVKASPVPRVEHIMRTYRKPSNRTEAEGRVMTETDKEYKRR